jgi:hypothetical protein
MAKSKILKKVLNKGQNAQKEDQDKVGTTD